MRALKITVLVVLIIFLISSLIPAAFVRCSNTDQWQQIGDPNPGETTDFMVDPENPNHFVVTSFYKSLKQSWNGGKTWENVWADSPSVHDAMMTTNLYWVNGVWFFNSWNYIYTTRDFKTFEKVIDINLVIGKDNAIDAFWTDDGSTFYIGLRPGGSSIGRFFMKSVDGGTTWKNLSTSYIQAIGGDPLDYNGVNRILLFKGIIYAHTAFNNAWCYSSDQGANFKKLSTIVNVNFFSTEDILFAGGQDGFFKSEDGLNWQIVSDKPLLANSLVYDVEAHIMYTVNPSIGVNYSYDQGKTWVSYSQGLTEHDLYDYTYYQMSRMPGRAIIRIYDGKLIMIMNTRCYSRSLLKIPQPINIVLHVGNPIFTVNGISQTLDSPPVIKNGRTLVPIRAIIEALGGTVGWDGVSRKATVILGNTSLELWIGKSAATVNGTPTPIDSTNTKVVPEIINGRTMLPLRFVTENLGATVNWEASTQTITITYSG